MSTHRFVESFITELDGLNIARTSTSAGCALVIPTRSCWKPSLNGHVKKYLDGGLSYDGRVEAAAVVCRDEHGQYLGTSAIVLPGVLNSTVLESIACREALALAADLSLDHLVIASDCKPIV